MKHRLDGHEQCVRCFNGHPHYNCQTILGDFGVIFNTARQILFEHIRIFDCVRAQKVKHTLMCACSNV